MTPEAQRLLTELQAQYKRVAIYATNYRFYDLPAVATEPFHLPADDWNSGHNSLIFVPAGAKIRLVATEEANGLGAYGIDAGPLVGLWVSDYEYKYGSEIPDIKECKLK